MREVSIIGVAMTRFAKQPERGLIELGREAAWGAIKDSGVSPKAIQVAYAGSSRTGELHHRQSGVGQQILWDLGISGIPISGVSNFCSSGSTALREAWMAVSLGLYDIAIAIGVEQLSRRIEKGKPLSVDGAESLAPVGFSIPNFFAQAFNRHSYEYGTTVGQLAKIAVKNRKNAGPNPRCQYREPITVEQVLSSTMISEPLTLLHCCPTTDGAAAVVICRKDIARKYSDRPVDLVACVMTSSSYEQAKSISTFSCDVSSATEAYEKSGLGPEDMDFVECHDCFTIAELIHYEDLGFCQKGEGGRMIDEGETEMNGRIPFSPSGGLLSRGHPTGATGIAQVVESIRQIRGIHENQVEGARVGMTHCMGGFQDTLEASEAAVSTVTILKRGW